MRRPFNGGMTSAIALFVSLASASSLSRATTIFDNDVEILQSDRSGVTLRYVTPEASFLQYEGAGKQFYLLNIPGTAQNGKEGEVEIPLKIVPLALPPKAHARIRVVDSQYEQVEYRRLAPFFARGSSEALRDAYLSEKADRPTIPPSQPYLATSGEIRGLKIARVAVPTAEYSLEPPSLSVLRSIILRVDFEGGREDLAAGFRDPGSVYNRILRKTVANYDVGRYWFTPGIVRGAEIAVSASPFDSATTWIRIEMSSPGIYAFGAAQFNLVGINPLSVDPSRVRVFYGGGRELPIPNSEPRPPFAEIPVEIIGGEDGVFNYGDLIVFYGDAVDGWDYSSQFRRYQHYRNHYTDKNVYWLTIDGMFSGPPRRFTVVDGTPDNSPDASVDIFTDHYHKEQETIFWRPDPSGDEYDTFEWYWGYDRGFSTTVQLYDVVGSGRSTIVVRRQSGTPSLRVNNGAWLPPESYQVFATYRTDSLREGLNNLELQSPSPMFLDYIDVHYPRWLKATDGALSFWQPDTFGIIRYNLTQVLAPYVLLDVSDKRNPVKIINGNLNGSTLIFDDTVSAQSHKQYCISSVGRLKSPGSVSLYQPDNLTDVIAPQNRADEIIVTYDGFYDQAVALAQHRQGTYGLATRVVRISDIYNQFSFGLSDPAAIRDFLKYAYQYWQQPAPTFALLLGDGNYDYRNNLGLNVRNYVPPFEAPYENDRSMSDEHFIYFGQVGDIDSDADSIPDMVIGRISARTQQEAQDVVEKIVDYDSHPDLGTWRDRIVVVADDNNHPPRDPRETFHTTQAEALSNRHVPSKFDVAKIYMVEYPLRAGGEKPEAREALIGAFNQGSLIINWIGHGSANLWADEHIFRKTEDIPRLANGKRQPLVFTASCSIGAFDDPRTESMAEELQRGRSKGAIASISATRPVYAGPNYDLNAYVFDQLLSGDSVGIGEALYMAKLLRSSSYGTAMNDRYYMVFGDPAQYLQFPKYTVRITFSPDSLKALSVDSLAGEIVDAHGNFQSDFNGTVWVTVKDGTVTRTVMMRDWSNNPLPGQNLISFLKAGSTIFLGPAEVRGGTFTSRFFVPKDVSYGSRGAKIYAYAENGSYDAVGVRDSILVSGTLPSVIDTTGPSIRLFAGPVADGRPFSAGVTMVPSGFTLGAAMQDEHGINITGQLGHAIAVSVDDGRVFEGDVTGYFRYDMGDYRSGALDFKMPAISLGEHDISIKVWDNFNNSSLITARIEVVATQSLELSDVMNYPNPVRERPGSTAFQYCLNADVDRVTIKVFTEAGRKIRTIDITSPDLTRMDCHQVAWNLRDQDGDPLANGVYIYKVIAEKHNGDGSSQKSDQASKLVILR